MPFGLTAQELAKVFFQQLAIRGNEYEGDLSASLHGENPDLVKQMEQLNEMFEGFDYAHFSAVMTILTAFIDVIVANNEALAKTIPHVEI